MRSAMPWTFILIALFGYGTIVLAAYIFQGRLLYFPDTYSRSESEQRAKGLGLALWKVGSEDYHGFISSHSAAGDARGTLLVFHGNAGSAADRSYYVAALTPLGYRVILCEYPGYGARGGRPTERSLVLEAHRAVWDALSRFGPPVYVWGESLGCGVASALAGDRALEIAGVVLLTPWDTLPAVAQSKFPFLPTRWIVKDHFDNIHHLKGFGGKIAVIMAGRDEIIPNRHTRRLYDAIEGDKRLWVFPDSGHNDWPASPGLGWWQEVMGFLSGSGDQDLRHVPR
jgi:pimeloyl-ACP methyl ester carboxylesterase